MELPETNKYVTTRNIDSNSSAIDSEGRSQEGEWRGILEEGENEQKLKYNMNL